MTAPPQPAVSVAIVEDDPRVSRSLCEMLESAEDVCCVGTFPNAEEALEKIPVLRPRVVLMDIHLPGSSGIECVHKLSRILPECLFVMLTSYDDSEALFASFSAGASGYLVKPVRTTELLDAVRDVFQGGAPMTSHIARRVVRALRPGGPPPASAPTGSPPVEGLSKREMEILTLLSQGCMYKEISDQLSISYTTVRTHVERIYRKLHVHSRSQAVALLHGLPGR